MRRAIYPGSFDPITNGHLDIIARSCKLFDEIIIAVLDNPDKNPLFSVEERCAMIEEVLPLVAHEGCAIGVEHLAGLRVDFAREKDAIAIVRGIRAISDYEYELQMASMNRGRGPELQTLFLRAGKSYFFGSPKLVKQVFAVGGAGGGLVPPPVEAKL